MPELLLGKEVVAHAMRLSTIAGDLAEGASGFTSLATIV